MRRTLAIVVCGLLAVLPGAVRAEEIPPSPLPLISYGETIGNSPPLPTSAEGLEYEARGVCESVGGPSADEEADSPCASVPRQSNRCFHIDVEPAWTSNGTSVTWAPYFNADCWVNKGTTIESIFEYVVTSSVEGELERVPEQSRSISPTKKIFSMGHGRRDCIRTVGGAEEITITGRVRAAGIEGRFVTPTNTIVCN